MMSRYKKLFSNTLIFTISEFGSKLLTFFMLPLYTTYLSSSEFGISDLINTTINLLIPFLTLSISSAVLRFSLSREGHDDIKDIFTIGLRITLLSILISWLLYPIFMRISIIRDYIYLFYLYFIAQIMDIFFNEFARGISKIKLVGVVGFIKTICVIFFNIIFLVKLKLGVQGYLLSYAIAFIISAILLAYNTRFWKYVSFKKVDVKQQKDMLRYSIPLVPNSISWWFNNSANKYIINMFIGSSQLGLFSAASRIPSILTTAQSIISQALVLSIIEEYEKEDSNSYYSEIYKYYNFLMVLGCSILILFTKFIASTLFGDVFYSAWKYVPFLLISTIFGAVSGYIGNFYSASKQNSGLFITTMFGGIVSILLNLILLPNIGVIGSSISSLISYFVIWVIRLLDTKKYVKLMINIKRDIMEYLLLILQSLILINVRSVNGYIYQISIIVLIVILNLNDLNILFNKIKLILLKRKIKE